MRVRILLTRSQSDGFAWSYQRLSSISSNHSFCSFFSSTMTFYCLPSLFLPSFFLTSFSFSHLAFFSFFSSFFSYLTYLVPFILVLTPVIYTFLVASPSSFSSSSPLLPLSIALSWSVLLLPLFVLPPITIVSPLSSSSFFSLTSFHFFLFLRLFLVLLLIFFIHTFRSPDLLLLLQLNYESLFSSK